MSTIASHSPLNISETVIRDRPRDLVSKDPEQDMASCHCRLTSLRSVEVSTTSCTSYSRLSGYCLKMPDYCNSVPPHVRRTGVPRLQSVQNAAARMVSGTRRSDITPVLRQLHWLPVRQSVDFKVATLVHRSLSGISPSQLSNDRRLVADVRERRLRSTICRTCVVAWILYLRRQKICSCCTWTMGTVFHRTRNSQTCRTIDSGGR